MTTLKTMSNSANSQSKRIFRTLYLVLLFAQQSGAASVVDTNRIALNLKLNATFFLYSRQSTTYKHPGS